MAWDVLIRGGEVVTPDGVRRLDVAIEGGTIVELAPELTGAARESIDAARLHVFPGVIDAHVHFNEPGRTDWEGFDTGSAALAAGGGTCFFDMPLNSHPPTLDGESFDLKRKAAEASSRTDFALWGGLTPGNLDKLEELADRGVVGFKAFMSDSGIEEFGRADDETLFGGMKIAAKLGLPVAVHAESQEITGRLTAEARAARRTSYADYLRSRPPEAEVAAIRTAVLLAKEAGCSLHVVHVSTPDGVQACTFAASGSDVTCETCPHYLWFDDEDLLAAGAALKCAPPLRNGESRGWLRKYLSTGMITTIGSDHSPAPASMKSSDDAFAAWGGIAGVQSTLPVMLTVARHCGIHVIGRLTAGYVATRFNIREKGGIAIGLDADLALVDVDAQYTLTRDMLLDRHKLSPYVGRRFRGLVRRTMVRGHTVLLDGRTVGDFRGRLVKPASTGRNDVGAAHA